MCNRPNTDHIYVHSICKDKKMSKQIRCIKFFRTEISSIFQTVICMVQVNMGKWRYLLIWFIFNHLFFSIRSVTMMALTGEHWAFVVETFIKTDESVIATPRTFCTYFMVRQNDAVPDRKSIQLWDESIRTTSSSI